jgi:hypothetical protein
MDAHPHKDSGANIQTGSQLLASTKPSIKDWDANAKIRFLQHGGHNPQVQRSIACQQLKSSAMCAINNRLRSVRSFRAESHLLPK